ncbi:hypothetical protein ACXET9_00560 [Brachybacterium sp. DNPG3]
MSTEQATTTTEQVEGQASVTTHEGNGLVQSWILFAILFLLFAGGLYVMAFFTPVTFLVGLGMSILALFLTFDTVPRFLS